MATSRPEQLNDIYNQCYAGLSLSFTNVSLVPHRDARRRLHPVVNESVCTIAPSSTIRLSAMRLRILTRWRTALEEIVVAARLRVVYREPAAASVTPCTWEDAGATVDDIFRRALCRIACRKALSDHTACQ